MIIRLIAASHLLEIDDPKNFKAFSLRVAGLIVGVVGMVMPTPARQRRLAIGIAGP